MPAQSLSLLPKTRPWRLGNEGREVCFEVLGIAQPKGSPEHFVLPNGRVAITERGPHKAWQKEVRDGAIAAVGTQGPLQGPLWARVVFYLPRPKSAPKTVRTVPDVRPDVDKLLRATLDGLRGVAITDDAKIVVCEVGKVYSSRPRVEVRVRGVRTSDLQWIGAYGEDEVMPGGH